MKIIHFVVLALKKKKNTIFLRYWGNINNYNSLLSVKRKYDPKNIFTCYHCIGYEAAVKEDPSVCPQQNCSCTNTPNGVCANVGIISLV